MTNATYSPTVKIMSSDTHEYNFAFDVAATSYTLSILGRNRKLPLVIVSAVGFD